MFRTLGTIIVVAVSFAGPTAAAQPDHHAHDAAMSEFGTVVFPTACNAPAQAHFTRGVSLLHSFEYEEAERSFDAAILADPDCAMAHWGVAMSHYHPLWEAPSSAALERGRAAIMRAQAIADTPRREQDYIGALATFYGSAGDHRARTFAYERAMEELSGRYPADHEAAIFYALSLIAAGMVDDDATFGRERKAAGILNDLLAAQPNHPGIAHYVIHSFDFPPLAQFALPAARRYAGIAPASAHAQHMPSHIFTRLGLWDEASTANRRAEAAARDYAKRAGLAGSWDERLHALDYLAYAYLQGAQDDKVDAILGDLAQIEQVDPANFKVAYAFAAIPARAVLERKRWSDAAGLALSANSLRAVPWEKFPWAEAHIHFARAVGAAKTGNLVRAREEIGTLEILRDRLSSTTGNYDWRTQVEIQRQIAAAWLLYAEGKDAPAIDLMRAVADLDDATEKHPVTPGQILPAREQLAEILLAMRRPADALREFNRTLEREPGRFNALYGAARAARDMGDRAKARASYASLLAQSCLAARARAELDEARRYLGSRHRPPCTASAGRE